MTTSVPAIRPHKPHTDLRRMVWQHYAHRIATWVRLAAILSLVPEVFEVIVLHFPAWADYCVLITFVTHQVAGFVQRKTQQYRWDI